MGRNKTTLLAFSQIEIKIDQDKEIVGACWLKKIHNLFLI